MDQPGHGAEKSPLGDAPFARRRDLRLALAVMIFVELLYFLPMAWGWHSVPFHLFGSRFTGVQYNRDLPASLLHMPGNDATPVIMDYPNEYYTALQMHQGRLPWWNPDIGTGRPWIGNAQVHPFSPLLLPLLLHPSPWTYSLQFVLGSLICLLGAFWMFRLMDLGILPALAGAMLWTWNPFTRAVYIMSSVWAYWWMPLAVAGTILALRRKKVIGWLLTAAALALMVLCGQPETALVLGEMVGILAFCLVLSKQGRRVSWRWTTGGLVLSVILAAALSSAQWVPDLVVLRGSVWYKSRGIAEGLTHPPASFFDPLSGVFLMPALLAAALLALRFVRWEAVGFSVMLLFSLGFSLPLAFNSLPYRLLRLGGVIPPLHGAELACIPAAGLCALGLEALFRRDAAPIGKTLRAAAALTCLALTGWAVYLLVKAPQARWMPAGWLAASALAFLWCMAGPARASRTAAVACLTALIALYPLASRRCLYPYFSGSPQPDWQAFLHLEPHGTSPAPRFWSRSNPRTHAPYLIPNLGLLSGVSDVRSSSVLNPPGSDVFSHGWGPGGYISHLTYTFAYAEPRLLSFLGVARVALPAPPPGPLFHLYDLRPGPRAFVASRVVYARDSEAALAAFKKLFAGNRQYETAIITASRRASPAVPDRKVSDAPKSTPATVTWLEREPARVRLDVRTPSGGLLVLTDACTNLWKARVDGAPVTVYRADVMFRGVPVPAGTHTVEMRYDTTPMAWSLWFCLAAWIAAGAWSLLLMRRESRRGYPDPDTVGGR